MISAGPRMFWRAVASVCRVRSAQRPWGAAMSDRTDRISPRLRVQVAEAAWYALACPACIYRTSTCKRLLGEAAIGRRLSRAALRTVLTICADVLADAKAADMRETA